MARVDMHYISGVPEILQIHL